MNIAVFDIGSKYLKCVLFNVGEVNTSIKHLRVTDIEDKSNNVITREITRALTLIKNYANIDEVIILPKTTPFETKINSYTIEYNDDKKVMKKERKAQMVDLGLEMPYVTDYISISYPEEDYQFVMGSSLSHESFAYLIPVLNSLKVPKYRVMSREQALASLTPRNGRVYTLIDVGHLTTAVTLCKDGYVLESHMFTDISGNSVDKLMGGKGAEVSTSKHTLPAHTLISAYMEHFASLAETVSSVIDRYEKNNNIKVREYFMLGGHANIDFSLEDIKTNLDSKYIPMVIDNQSYIKGFNSDIHPHLLNLIMPSLGALNLYLSPYEVINFASPKEGGFGVKLKSVNKLYTKFKNPIHNAMYAFAGLIIFLAVVTPFVKYKLHKQKEVLNVYASQLEQLRGNLQEKSSSLEQLLNQETAVVQSNVGKVQEQIALRTPPNLSIRQISSDFMQEYLIEGYSDSDTAIADFMDFLENGVFEAVLPISKVNEKTFDGKDIKYFKIKGVGVLSSINETYLDSEYIYVPTTEEESEDSQGVVEDLDEETTGEVTNSNVSKSGGNK